MTRRLIARSRSITGSITGSIARSIARSIAMAIARCLALSTAMLPSISAAQEVPAPIRPQPLAIVRVTGLVVRAPAASRVDHVATSYLDRLDLSMRIDSALAGVMYSTTTLYQPAGANASATVRIPLQLGVLGPLSISTSPRPERALAFLSGEGAALPKAEAERVAAHAHMRQLVEVGALFESAPAGGSGTRRTRFSDGSGDIALTIEAVRSSRTLRDTSVSGRRVHIVRDSTAVTLDHSTLTPSRFHKTVTRTRETVRGAIVGLRLVDAETRRTFRMQDTLTLQGTLVSDDGMGGAFRSPLFIRSVRQSSLHDAFWQAAIPREAFDMVSYNAPRAQRITSARYDSLFSLLDTARSLGTRDSVRARLLSPDAPRDSTVWPRVWSRSLAIGDTASAIERAINRARWGDLSIDAAAYRVMREPLASAEAAFRLGVDREVLALNLIELMLRKPPLLAAEGEAPVCLPAGCAAMRADAMHGQPGLQAVALVASMVTEPRIWTDSVVEYAATNPYLSTRALLFAQGVASDAPASAKAPIPEPDATYDAWRHWLMGRDSSYVQALRADVTSPSVAQQMLAPPRRLEVPPQAAIAVRFAQARTGLDYVAALRRHRDTTSADSARALFGAILIAVGDRRFTEDQLARVLLGPMGPEREVAAAQLRETVLKHFANAPRASDSMSTVIGRHIVSMVFADSAPTRTDTDVPWNRWHGGRPVATEVPRYVLMHSYPDAVRARAAELGFAPVERGWQLRPGDDGLLVEFSPVQQSGRFVSVSVTYTLLKSRGASRSGGFASGFSLVLVEGPAGWTVVDAVAWVT